MPDPRKITDDELNDVVKKVLSLEAPDKLNKFLDSYKGKFTYYVDTSWNQKAPEK